MRRAARRPRHQAGRHRRCADGLHTGVVEIHPFDDPRVQAGQGTATLELLEVVPAIGMVVAPVSGGGLLSGTAVAAHDIEPSLPVWGAEPAGADGLVAQLSDGTLAILQDHAVQVVTVTEDQIVEGMRRLAVDAKQVVEPSGAVDLTHWTHLVLTSGGPG